MLAPGMHVGDARKFDALGIEPESVDCMITSPPYWGLKRYGSDSEVEVGQEGDLENYLSNVGTVLEQCYCAAKPEGVLWLIADTLRQLRTGGLGELIPLPLMLGEVARDKGWRLQEIVVWRKNKTRPYSGQGKLRNLIEYILFFTKGECFKHRPHRCSERHGPQAEWLAGWPERYSPLGRAPSNIWTIPISTQGMWSHAERLHFCPLPQQLVARCLDLTTDKGDVVLDPFAGIGTVPAQAFAMGRVGYGIELNPSFTEIYTQRLLPAFQASWERDAETRELALRDQLDEAELLLKLRALKAGRELLRTLETINQRSPGGHPANHADGVAVIPRGSLRDAIDPVAGTVARPTVSLVVVTRGDNADSEALLRECERLLHDPPFTTFGLTLEPVVAQGSELAAHAVDETGVTLPLLEFGQSRHGAFTASIPEGPRATATPLLTTIALPRAIQANGTHPLDEIADRAIREMLEREVAGGGSLADIANHLGLPQVELHELLVRHGLRAAAQSFAVSLP